MYIQLQEGSLKALELIRANHPKKNLFYKMNNQIREWIRNLKTKCPDEEVKTTLIEFINNEYTEYKA